MVANKGMDSLSNSWTNAFTALPDFKEAITYDGNGNILTYNRNGNKTFAASPLGMDSMTYHYRPGTNKLTYVTDLVKGANYGNDIDNQVVGNYKYDRIGNMVSDVRAGVDSIRWNVYGKISKIYKHDSTSIAYTYDAAGNRISKAFTSKTKDVTYTFYVRDATGNILSVYAYNDTAVNGGQLSQIEADLYGSSRLGMTTLATNVQDQSAQPVTILTGLGNGRNINFTRGKKFFELTNHLGNVLATVSDKKIGVSANSSTIDSYNPVITSAQEYYPFGMLMPGRGGHIGAGRNVLGSTVVMNGDTVPSTLTVSQRAASLPATYTATEVISFEAGFVSAAGDQFVTMFVDQTSTDPGTESGVSYGIDAKGYRYGFNGKENDNEVKGEGNEQDYGMRIYDSRVGKFLSVDPLTMHYSFYKPYQFAGNTPTKFIDLDGAEQYDPSSKPHGVTHISIAKAPEPISQSRSVWLGNYEMRGFYGSNGAAYWVARYHYTEGRYKGGYNDEWVVGPDGFVSIAEDPKLYHARAGWVFLYGGGGREFNLKSIYEGWKEINTTPSNWINGAVVLGGGVVAMGEANLLLNETSSIAQAENARVVRPSVTSSAGSEVLDLPPMYETRPVSFAKTVSRQKQARHLLGTAPKDKGYLNSMEDAQAVLDAYNSGNYRLINSKANQNSVTIEVLGVEGRYVNLGGSIRLPDLNLPTHKFMIEGSASPKVVPVNPNK